MAKAKDVLKLSDVTLLRRARAAVVRGWTKGGFWTDRAGHEVDEPRKVCRVCTSGACALVTARLGRAVYNQPQANKRRADRLLMLVTWANPGVEVVTFTHSSVTKRTVLGWFDNAIAVAHARDRTVK